MLWLFMGLLVVLVCVLAVLQYKWIGEISASEQKQRQYDLQAAANNLSSAFNAELNTSAAALQPSDQQVQDLGRTKAYENRYTAWRASARIRGMFRRVAVVGEENGRLALRMFNAETGALEPAEWPADWTQARDFIAARLLDGTMVRCGPIIPRWSTIPGSAASRIPAGRPAEQDWLLLDVDSQRAGTVILPEFLAQYLTEDFRSQYRVEVVSRANPSEVIFATDSGQASSSAGQPQASVTLFDPPRPGRGRGPGPAPAVPGQGCRERFRTWTLAALGVAAEWFARNRGGQRPPPQSGDFRRHPASVAGHRRRAGAVLAKSAAAGRSGNGIRRGRFP